MSVRFQLPPVLRHAAGGAQHLDADGASIAAALGDLARRHPPLRLHLFDEKGAIRRNIVFLHGGELVRAGEAGTHQLAANDSVILTNALAGG